MFQVSPEYVNNRSPQGQAPIVPRVSNASRIRNAQRRDTTQTTQRAPEGQSRQIRNVTHSAFSQNNATIGEDTREPYRTTTDRAGADSSRPTISDSFNEQYGQRGIRNIDTDTRLAPVSETASSFYLSAKNQRQLARTLDRGVMQSNDTSAKRPAAIETKKQSSFAAKRIVKSINLAVGTPLFMYWISIQVPLAVIGMVFIGLAAAVESNWVGSAISSLIGSVSNLLLGTNISEATLYAPALGIMMILFLFGLAIFIGLLFAYLLIGMKQGIRPVFGRGFLLKLGTLLCVALYIVPLINLFPLHVPYMMVMRRYPK